MAGNPDAVVLRTEHCLVTWGIEDQWGTMVSTDKRFGIHETVNAADPDLQWYPFFGVSSGRSRQAILRGRWSLQGGVPNIKIQSGGDLGSLLGLAIGRFDGSVVKEGKTDTDERVKSMTMQIAGRDTDGNYSFIRNYFGGKINRMTLSANEGEELQLTIDEIIFKDTANNFGKSIKNTGVSLGSDPGLIDAGRFVFAGATLKFFGTELARIKNISLSVDNQLEAKYYLSKSRGEPDHMTQVCNDIVEGRRVYALDCELDVVSPDTDLDLLDAVLSQGVSGGGDGHTVGGVIEMDFDVTPGEGSGTMTIQCSINPTSINPGSVIRTGKANVPAPPGGYYPSNYSIDVDRIQITLPSGVS